VTVSSDHDHNPREEKEMASTTHTDCSEQELDFRANDGLEVTLLWRAGDECLIVEVVDTKLGDAFRFEVAATQGYDAFQHPYAYAAFRGVEYGETWHLRAEPVLA
jgi:hypothetical protein